MVRLRHCAFFGIILLFSAAQPSLGDDAQPAGEYGILGGYGITHRGFGATVTQVQTVDAIARIGWFLSGEHAQGSLFQGRHELLVEIPLHLTVDPRTRIMTGLYLLGSWKFTGLSEQKLYPYAFAGGGPLYNDLGLATQGTRINYSYQGGVGLQYLFRKDLALIGEYRYHHVSNAGTAEPNEPLNSSKILVGLTRFF
ncbi:lipid A 3-O-deacylase [Geobacter sp. OR-1]|uniref:acyloxyacyl hydrolase n=1 Tax=Geobacter sp. OR-1 TaxID=1266765 RepID=UPI000543D0A6|nr:acyloxyacyl hydrolase [Geobacter sp. OR-1]GAM08849.1 lipid A 3-O-deacylase [Geobacter sp. OR-1]